MAASRPNHKARVAERSRGVLRAVLLALVVLPGWAAGGEPPEAEEAPTSEFIETATVRARAIGQATAEVDVIDRAMIEALDVPTVGELLRFVPGLNVSGTGPRAGFATAQIRGGDPNYTYVMIDGVALNDSTDPVGGAVNLNSLSTAHVERIEIVRGPLSSLFGSTGLGGAINIITRKGSQERPAFDWALAGGDDSTAIGSAALSQAGERHDFFVGATWDEQENAIDRGGAQDDFDELGLQGNTRIVLSDATELRLSGRVARWDTLDYPEASGGPLLGSGELRDSEHREANLGVELRLGPAGHEHRLRASGYTHDLDRESPFIFNPSVPEASVPASDEDTRYSTYQLGWTAPELRFRSSRLSLGLDGRFDDGESDSSFPDLGLDLAYDVRRATGGAFAEYVIEHGGAVIEIGARVDVPEDFDTELSPRAGVTYSLPDARTRLRASVGRAFKLPSFFAQSVPVFGNPDLEPETVVGVDSAVEHTFGFGLGVALTLFYNRFHDLVDFDDTLFKHVNIDHVEAVGTEFAADWHRGERFDVHVTATRQEFHDEEAGNPLTHRPEWVGSARLSWRFAERFRWGLDGQWISEAFDFQVPVGTERVAGYQLYGTVVTVDLGRGFEFHARVDNLTDKEYEPFIGFPGPDRSYRFGVRYHAR